MSEPKETPPMASLIMGCCKKSLKISLIVGTILSAINQGEAILDGAFVAKDLMRTFLNYLVPLFVASYSRLALIKEMKHK